MGLLEAIEDPEVAARACGILALVGVVNIPIIHYSVEWWYTLHQGATILKFSKPSIAPSMLWPLLLMFGAFALLFMASVIMRTRNQVLSRRLATS
jgi:heme exporter protein C